jgi:hypothetical protein
MPELFQDFVTAAVTNYWKVQLVDLDEILRWNPVQLEVTR